MRGDVARDRHASVAHHGLEHVLVHRERRAEDACADVRHSRELEQALHRPVLPEGPVQDREDDGDVPEGGRHLCCGHRQRLRDGAGLAAAELPAAVAPDLDRDRVVAALGVEGVPGQSAPRPSRSCSEERPPMRTATRTPRSRIAGSSAGCVNRPTVILTVEPCGARCSPGLWSSDPLEPRVGDVLVLDLHLEPRAGERVAGRLLV